MSQGYRQEASDIRCQVGVELCFGRGGREGTEFVSGWSQSRIFSPGGCYDVGLYTKYVLKLFTITGDHIK